MRTLTPGLKQIRNNWVLIDAENKVLGRLSTKVASILRGKDKPMFAPNMDTGDFVIVINAEKVKLTGSKTMQKTYDRYSGYPGGLNQITFRRMYEKKPEEIIRHAVRGMLPKSPLGRKLFRKLKVYAGDAHPHSAQLPRIVEV